jgi:hypothetical protein
VALVLENERAVRLLDLRGLLGELTAKDIPLEVERLLPGTPPVGGPLPAAPPFTGVGRPSARNGLRAEIFADPLFQHRVKVRYDTTFPAAWRENPANPASADPGFSVRWTGWIVPPEKGLYQLRAHGHGRVRVSPWKHNNLPEWAEALHVSQIVVDYTGEPIPIRIDFARTEPDPNLNFEWSKGKGERPWSEVPATALFPTKEEARRGE